MEKRAGASSTKHVHEFCDDSAIATSSERWKLRIRGEYEERVVQLDATSE